MHSLLLCTETTLSKRSFHHYWTSHGPTTLLKIGNLITQKKRSQSPPYILVGPRAAVFARKIPTPRAGAYGKTAREAVGMCIAGYFYKPPLRGQVTVCLTTTLLHL